LYTNSEILLLRSSNKTGNPASSKINTYFSIVNYFYSFNSKNVFDGSWIDVGLIKLFHGASGSWIDKEIEDGLMKIHP